MISGILAEGEKATQLTQSVCTSSVIVYLHSARVFHRRIVRSREPDTIWRLSAEKATVFTSDVWPVNARTDWPTLRSQRRMVLSQLALSANCPSELVTTSCTAWLCPVRHFRAYPGSSSPGVSSHTITVLSRDEEMITFGFSWHVAIPVTQLRWPLRTPRSARVSAIADSKRESLRL